MKKGNNLKLQIFVVAIFVMFTAVCFAQQANPELFKTGASNYQKQTLENFEIKEMQKANPKFELLKQRNILKQLKMAGNKPDMYKRNKNDNLFSGSRPDQNYQKSKSIFYNTGRMNLGYPDSVYYHFETGDNSDDTLGMDVMVTSNEGVNFGNEGNPFFVDPSMLYYLSVDSSLDMINEVPSIYDTSIVWTDISWDWNGGNNGQPLAPGNIWVVYTRTTNCYVVLEVTEASSGWNDTWFEFNYKYQPNGTTDFSGGSVPVDYNFLVNGEVSDTITVGDQPEFTFNFPDGISELDFNFYWDVNEDGMLDDSDYFIDYMGLSDNDENDQDPASGSYTFVLDDESEGMNRLHGSMIYEVCSYSGCEATHLYWNNLQSEFSISGQAINGIDNEPIQGIIVIAFAMNYDTLRDDDGPGEIWIDFTDSDGNYFINVPSPVNNSGIEYQVMSQDYLQVTNGLVGDPSDYEIWVNGDMTGYDFIYNELNSAIYGYVFDDKGNPIEGIGVCVNDFSHNNYYSDASGHFSIPVPPGEYRMNFINETVIPDYMLPNQDKWVVVEPNDSIYVEFNLFETDATISGNVYLNGVPAPWITIDAWHERWGENQENYGWTQSESDESGYYELHVKADESEEDGGYGINVWDKPPGTILETELHNIPAGATGIDINLITVEGGLYGAFIDGVSGDTLYENVGMMARNMETQDHYSTWPDYETGEYILYLPDGMYEIHYNGPGYSHSWGDTLLISGSLIHFDVIMDPIILDGAVYGYITNCITGFPIEDAEVNIGNNLFWNNTYTDEDGYYWIDVPEGHYGMSVHRDGYNSEWRQVEVQQNEIEENFCLNSIESDAVFKGTVYGENVNKEYFPLPWAGVHVHNWEFDFFQITDDSGNFYFDLPNGFYLVEIAAEEYLMQIDSIYVDNETVTRDYYLEKLNIEGFIAGRVFEENSNSPIGGASVFIGNIEDSTGFHQFTGPNGFYSFGVPNGVYIMRVEAENYITFFKENIVVENDTVAVPVPMEKFGATLYGFVYDENSGNPIPNAWIDVENLETGEWYYAGTDFNGYFNIGVPNGLYQIYAGADQYEWSASDSMWVEDEEVYLEFNLRKEMGEAVPPNIVIVKDVPNDQGKQVRIVWQSGYLEWGNFKEYSIWRNVHDELWDFIATVPFIGYGPYSYVSPTLIDSNAYTGPEENFWSDFIVVAHTNMPDFILYSDPVSGYSIDNLHPHAPLNFRADAGETDITLSWKHIDDEDFDYYEIYRGTSSGFQITEPFAVTIDTSYIDNSVQSNESYYYIIKSVDFNGNASNSSQEVSASPVSITPEHTVPDEYSLAQNYPNPFNPTTVIKFGLPEDARVQVFIYNLNGYFIRELTNDNFNAGYHILNWDATDNSGSQVSSGIYIYTIVTENYKMTKKMVLIR